MRRVLAAALLCWLACPAAPAPLWAQVATADTASADWEQTVTEERSWLGRLLHRYFGRAPRSGAELAGRAESLVETYAPYAGRTIEVVIVNPVLRFDGDLREGQEVSWGALMRLATPLWSYTRESIVRQYLLFGTGDRIDPFKLADSERLLRQLDYMNDVRILVLPIGGTENSVAIVVETRDRWPFGVTGNIIDANRFDASIYGTNALGLGVRVDNKVLVHRERDPSVGYRGYLAKENLGGSFVDARLEYEDSWRKLSRVVSVQRGLVHPAIRWVGGYYWQLTDDRDNEGKPRKFDQNEFWLGRAFLLGQDDPFRIASGRGLRRTLTPAASITDLTFSERPAGADRDSLRSYHDQTTYLLGLTYASQTNLRTSYLFRMGETEDVPAGFVLKASAGYEDGEFLRRSVGYAEADFIAAGGGGNLEYGKLAFGGYLREQVFEDGLLLGRIGYITPLLGQGRWRHRLYGQLTYLLGINRSVTPGIVLGDRTGIRDLDNSAVQGDQRLVLKLESRLFTPWRVFGFDTMLFVYGDAGLVGGELDPIFQQKIYTSLGLGVRVSNPDLVLPTFELRVGLLQAVEGQGFRFSLDLGNLSYPDIIVPGPRPGPIPYR